MILPLSTNPPQLGYRDWDSKPFLLTETTAGVSLRELSLGQRVAGFRKARRNRHGPATDNWRPRTVSPRGHGSRRNASSAFRGGSVLQRRSRIARNELPPRCCPRGDFCEL